MPFLRCRWGLWREWLCLAKLAQHSVRQVHLHHEEENQRNSCAPEFSIPCAYVTKHKLIKLRTVAVRRPEYLELHAQKNINQDVTINIVWVIMIEEAIKYDEVHYT